MIDEIESCVVKGQKRFISEHKEERSCTIYLCSLANANNASPDDSREP